MIVGVVVKTYPKNNIGNKFYVHELIKIGVDSDAAVTKSNATNVNETTPINNNISQDNTIVKSNIRNSNENNVSKSGNSTDIAIGKNNKSVISIELDVYKNVEGVKDTNYKGNYNLVITLFSANDNYAENLKRKQEMSVLYEKKEDTHSSDLTSENVMLGSTENVSSNTIIAGKTQNVNDSVHNDKNNVPKSGNSTTANTDKVVSAIQTMR